MLEKKQSHAVSLKSHVKKESDRSLSLVELIRQDAELMEFFRLVRDQDLRQRAFELLQKKINGPVH